MHVLVTGGTGFLGRALALSLVQRGDVVSVLGRNAAIGSRLEAERIRFFKSDLTDERGVAEACTNQEVVVHCGGLASPWGPYASFHDANVTGTKNVIDACRRHGVRRLVHVSTPSVYYDGHDRTDVRESDPIPSRAKTAYAKTKLKADHLVDALVSTRLEAITIRPSRVFGPGDRNIFPRVLRAAESGGVPLVGGGRSLIDMTYIDNVVDALTLCIDAAPRALYKTYNITNGEPLPIKAMFEKLFAALGTPLKTRRVPFAFAFGVASALEVAYKVTRREGEPPFTRYGVGLMSKSQTFDITAARASLGYSPRVRLDDGILRFAAWWKTERPAG